VEVIASPDAVDLVGGALNEVGLAE